MASNLPFEYTIGLEIHVQLKTASKMFCRCSNAGENESPNTTVCPVCMGHPGTLPVMNAAAVRMGAKASLALNCTINEESKFDRKNYFYPDLPKGYQISQYDQPLGIHGYVDIAIPGDVPRSTARIRIRRLHLEEDAAKLLHAPGSDVSLVDFNRAGTPLAEIVTEPDFKTPLEAKIFLQELRLLARYLDISSADMEKGHLRCDANISIQTTEDGAEVSSAISEIKNLNSFRAVERALEYERNRLREEWTAGGEVRTRNYKITVGWDEQNQKTIVQRWKEEAHDYRYFPEPDLPPLRFSHEAIDEIRAELPELPQQKRQRLISTYGISLDDARILVDDRALASFFENACSELDAWLCALSGCDDAFKEKSYKLLSAWTVNKLQGLLASTGQYIDQSKLTPENMAQLIAYIAEDKINSTTAQEILEHSLKTAIDPAQMIKEQGLEQVSDSGLIGQTAQKIVDANPDAVANYKAGKENAIMFLVGQVMKELKGKGQPELIRDELKKILS
ncbi:Asp-tRNA(Asn)/Glu-tRNA(Gln) amidotransferase subunit GatB [Candidatus Uhrbacteria bacterium]|nr:Asp-tRNA(Asn)/Glu-tRNA(Gln) amidotransferase subunit GatB [Candidatus Uhrbacteria bacterium]